MTIPGDDTTKRMFTPQAPHAALSVNEQFRVLSQRLSGTIEALRNWREELMRLGMNLPTGTLDTIRSVEARLKVLSQQQAGTTIELRQLRELAQTTALINSTLDTSEVLNQVMDRVIQLTGAERGYIMLKNAETGELDFRVARGIDREQLGQQDFKVSRTVVNRVADSGEAVLTDNALADERFGQQQSIVGMKLRSILAVPLKMRDATIGVVYCDNSVLAGIFQQHELQLAAAFANQAGAAIENARLFESARARLREAIETRDLMENIFTSIASGVITLDNDNLVTICNTAARRIIDMEIAEVLGKPVDTVLPMLDGDFMAALESVHHSGVQQLLTFEPVLNGEPRIWNVIISSLRDSSGGALGLAIVLDDMTETRRREAQFQAAGLYLPRKIVENLRSLDQVNVGGEEREITAVFADVRGFTSFSEKLEPEELMEIINQYLSLASDAIDFYGGIVDKYMGDAVTGLFNTQVNPQDDHAVACVRAAMNMIFDLLALHEHMPEEHRLFYGVGIHTGAAVLGNVGGTARKEFSALGDATDTAKLLQENAGKGEIIISQATYDLVRDYFECEPRTPNHEKMKGRTDIEVVYRVVKRKRGAPSQSPVSSELLDLLKED